MIFFNFCFSKLQRSKFSYQNENILALGQTLYELSLLSYCGYRIHDKDTERNKIKSEKIFIDIFKHELA